MNSDFLTKQVESVPYNRVYLLHKKVHTNTVGIFLRMADSKLKSLFTQNVLVAIWSGNKRGRNGTHTAPQFTSTRKVTLSSKKLNSRENATKTIFSTI